MCVIATGIISHHFGGIGCTEVNFFQLGFFHEGGKLNFYSFLFSSLAKKIALKTRLLIVVPVGYGTNVNRNLIFNGGFAA